MFVKIMLETNYCGEQDETVREFPDDTTDEVLDAYIADAADDNALSFGSLDEPEEDEVDSDDDFRETFGNWEKLNMTREEIEDEGYEIMQP